MRTVLVVALVSLLGCMPTQHNKRVASAITLAVSTVALACDMGQTMRVSQAGWPGSLHEGNMMLGEHPSVAALGLYNAGVASANVGAWVAIPDKYDWILPVALAVFETTLVAKNSIGTPQPFCGIH